MRRALTLILPLLALSSCGTYTATPSPPASTNVKGLLSALSVPSVRIYPDFSPETTDYVAECKAGAVVSPVATPVSDTVKVDVPKETLFSPSSRITIAAKSPDASVSYSIRCLPRDFPDITAVGRSSTWFFASLPAESPGASFEVLFSPSGVPVWYRRVSGPPPLVVPVSSSPFRFLEMRPHPSEFGPYARTGAESVSLINELGETMSSWKMPSKFAVDQHDMVPLENGNLLVISYEETTPPPGLSSAPFAAAHPVFGKSCSPGPFDAVLDRFLDSVVLEVAPSGKVVRKISMKEKLGATAVSIPLRFDAPAAPASNALESCMYDAYHVNALDVSSDSLAVTGLSMDGVAVFDLQSSELLYTLSSHESPRSLRILADPLSGPLRPHDGRLSTSSQGQTHLSFFDNRMGDPLSPPRYVSYNIDLKTKTASLKSSVPASCPSAPCGSPWGGSARLAPSSSGTSVLLGLGGRSGVVLEERSLSGKLLFSLSGPTAYRFYPVPAPGNVQALRESTDLVKDAPPSKNCARDYFGVCSPPSP